MWCHVDSSQSCFEYRISTKPQQEISIFPRRRQKYNTRKVFTQKREKREIHGSSVSALPWQQLKWLQMCLSRAPLCVLPNIGLQHAFTVCLCILLLWTCEFFIILYFLTNGWLNGTGEQSGVLTVRAAPLIEISQCVHVWIAGVGIFTSAKRGFYFCWCLLACLSAGLHKNYQAREGEREVHMFSICVPLAQFPSVFQSTHSSHVPISFYFPC